MKKRQRAPKVFVAKTAGVVTRPPGPKLLTSRFGLATLTVLLVSVIGATAANTVYHGHVSISQDRKMSAVDRSEPNSNAVTPPAPARSAVSTKKTSDLVAKYGPLAKSQAIAAAIKQVESVQGAKAAADRFEALEHGRMLPGTDPMLAVMYGSVPKGMQPEQFAIVSRALPKMPTMPRTGPITEEMADRLAGVPDPTGELLRSQALSSASTSSMDQRFIEDSIRSHVGPVQFPLHRSHDRFLEPANKILAGTVRERANQTSTIQAQYSYDPYGQQTRVAGTGPDSDFGFAGGYVHQPSGLVLMGARFYNPSLGRWINRDPIGEAGCVNLYQYALNRPTSVIDPTGLDVVILYDPSSLPTGSGSSVGHLGHCAALVGNDNSGWNLYSNAPSSFQASSPSLTSFFSNPNPNFSRYSPMNSSQIPTTPDQDAAANAAGQQSLSNFHGAYHNCSNTCRDILNAAGVGVGAGGFAGTGFLSTPAGTFSAANAAGGVPPLFVP